MQSIQLYILLFFIILSCCSKQVILSKQNEKYVFKLDIANLKINLQPVWSLENSHSWIKSEQCKYCRVLDQKTNQQSSKNLVKYQEKSYDCSQGCFEKSQEQYGLKCIQTHSKCTVINENFEMNMNSKVMKGKLIKLKGQASQNHQKFDQIQVFLVDKIFALSSQVQKSSLTKNEQKLVNKDEKLPDLSNKIGQYSIWGKQSFFDRNIITKNTKGQIFIYDGIKQNKLEKQILEDIPSIDIEFEQTETLFSLSQIKLNQKITLNHSQKETQDHQFPILPQQKGFFTLQSQNLLLPKKHYDKFIKYLVQTYFSQEKNKCELKDSKISCEKAINLDKVQYLQLQLILNGKSIGFPLNSLLKNYKGKTIDLRITETDSTFVIGTFFLEIFAVQFIKETQNLRLHRLNNQWNKFYSKDQKYHKENFNIFWWMGTSVFYLIFYSIKIIFYLALFSLLVNFIYHWRKIFEWIGKIVRKITGKKGQGQLFQQDQQLQPKDTAKLIKKFKNRRSKVFVEDQPSLADEITTQESN